LQRAEQLAELRIEVAERPVVRVAPRGHLIRVEPGPPRHELARAAEERVERRGRVVRRVRIEVIQESEERPVCGPALEPAEERAVDVLRRAAAAVIILDDL